jgi:hypothetical protein
MKIRGFYVIDEKFFLNFPDPYLKGNKSENRPHYYCLKCSGGLYWIIPMSGNFEKYQRIIDRRRSLGQPSDFLYVAKLDNGKKNAFLIGDMFPVTENYIKREYTFNSNHLKVTSESVGNQIEKQAKTVLGLIRLGHSFSPTQPDSLKIEKELLNRIENKSLLNT